MREGDAVLLRRVSIDRSTNNRRGSALSRGKQSLATKGKYYIGDNNEIIKKLLHCHILTLFFSIWRRRKTLLWKKGEWGRVASWWFEASVGIESQTLLGLRDFVQSSQTLDCPKDKTGFRDDNDNILKKKFLEKSAILWVLPLIYFTVVLRIRLQ